MVKLDDGLVAAIRGAVEARREDAVALLRELVRTPSVTGEEGAVAGVVERALGARSLDVDTWEATPEEMEPYRDHVGEQDSYENRPNVVGHQEGMRGRAFDPAQRPHRHRGPWRPGRVEG